MTDEKFQKLNTKWIGYSLIGGTIHIFVTKPPAQIIFAPNITNSIPEINIRVKADAEADAAGANSNEEWTNSFKARLAEIKKRLAAKEKQKEEGRKAKEEVAASGDKASLNIHVHMT